MKFVLKVICTLKKNNENILHDMPPMLHYWFGKSVQFGNYQNRSEPYFYIKTKVFYSLRFKVLKSYTNRDQYGSQYHQKNTG